MINSGWKFILLLVFGSLTSNLTHVLNFYNFTLQFSVENWYHFLIVRKSSTTPGNHKSVWSPSKVVEKISPPGGGGLNRVFTVTHSYPRNHYTQRLHSFSLEFPKLGFSSSSEQNFGIPQTWVPCLPHQNHEFGFSTKTFKRVPMRKCQQLICQCFFSGMFLGTSNIKSAAVRSAYRTLVNSCCEPRKVTLQTRSTL